MDKLVRYIDCVLPSKVCNLHCSYCYLQHLGVDVYQARNSEVYKYSEKVIRKALSLERLGGVSYLAIVGIGETLADYESLLIIKELLNEGHYVEVTTNGTLTTRFEQLLEMLQGEECERLKFTFSLHFVELKKRDLLGTYFENIKKVRARGCSFSVTLQHCDEYLRYSEEISKMCKAHIGALPQLAVTHKRQGDGTFQIASVLSKEDYYQSAQQYHSPLFEYLWGEFGKKQTGFCHAGEWSFVVDLGTGVMTKCHANGPAIPIFDDPDAAIPFAAVGNACGASYCHCSRYLALGNIPGVCEEWTLASIMDRPDANWLNEKWKKICSQKLYDAHSINLEYLKEENIFDDLNSKKKVLLLGDSISMNYRQWVKDKLQADMEVVYPKENGRFAAYTYRSLYDWESEIGPYDKVDLVYWNNGLWDVARVFEGDVQTDIEMYQRDIVRVYKLLRKLCPKAIIIFANSTKVVEKRYTGKLLRRNEDIKKYNEVAEKVVKDMGGEIDDLFAITAKWTEIAWSDATHFKTGYSQKLGKHIATRIELAFNDYVNIRCQKRACIRKRALERLMSGESVVLWGCGANFENNIDVLKGCCQINGVCDENIFLHGQTVYGVKCISPNDIEEYAKLVVITVSDKSARSKIEEQLIERKIYFCELDEVLEAKKQLN